MPSAFMIVDVQPGNNRLLGNGFAKLGSKPNKVVEGRIA